jgi:hypothetical protein
MHLPPFLKFLAPIFPAPKDRIGISGHLRIERQEGDGPKILVHDSPNFIVDAGKTAVRDMLLGDAGFVSAGSGFLGSIHRMAVGHHGTPEGELFNPKLPDGTWGARTTLFREVLRQDVSTFSAPTAFSARFVGSFNSLDVVDNSFDWATKVINEACLVIGDGILTIGGDKIQINGGLGHIHGTDEVMLSMRTFNSLSFDNAEDITITVTWTITVTSAS